MAQTQNKSQILHNEPLLDKIRDTRYQIRDTSHERPLNPDNWPLTPGDWSFMQNKPNFLKAKMNVNSIPTKDYENECLLRGCQNKPNQTQSNPMAK